MIGLRESSKNDKNRTERVMEGDFQGCAQQELAQISKYMEEEGSTAVLKNWRARRTCKELILLIQKHVYGRSGKHNTLQTTLLISHKSSQDDTKLPSKLYHCLESKFFSSRKSLEFFFSKWKLFLLNNNKS